MKIKVVSKEVQLHAFSVYPYKLPTFSKGVQKDVYIVFGFIKIHIQRYLMFTYIATIPCAFNKWFAATDKADDEFVYLKTYVKIKRK